MSDISISVDFDELESNAVHLEVDLQGEPILFGAWEAEVRCRGRLLTPLGCWTETCACRRNGCDYLEIDLPLTHGFRLQRFFLADHDDRVLILGDTVLRDFEAAGSGRFRKEGIGLQYESSLHFSAKLHPESTDETSERTFRIQKSNRSKPLFRLLPLSLPQREDAAPTGSVHGIFDIADSVSTLRQETSGRAMFAPLFFDLAPDRLKKRLTWKRLTIGENLEAVPDDHAVGYRVQIGKEQFLVYRSMTPTANRTVLGHNLIDDFCFARFDATSGVEALVEIQQESDGETI